jgi:hypothetical protein
VRTADHEQFPARTGLDRRDMLCCLPADDGGP